MKKVITIEPAKQVTHKVELPRFTKRRVAGYARVSTDHEDQTTSYEAQMTYYTVSPACCQVLVNRAISSQVMGR